MYPKHLQKYIPPGFDIDNYQETANMEIGLWVVNILIKLMGYKVYESQIDLSSIPPEDFENIMIAYEALIGKALIKEPDDQFTMMITELLIEEDQAKYTAQVRELTYYDLFNIADDLKTGEYGLLYLDRGKQMIPLLAMLLQEKLGKLNEPVDYYDKYWENNSSSLLKVDLDCSDSEIKTAFSNWLKEKRSNQKAKNSLRRSYQMKNFNKVTFRKWHDARVLPYMDLVTWNYAQGNKLTSKAIGDILFHDQLYLKDTTAVVNDTVKPLATKLTNIATIKRMIKAFAETNRKKIT